MDHTVRRYALLSSLAVPPDASFGQGASAAYMQALLVAPDRDVRAAAFA